MNPVVGVAAQVPDELNNVYRTVYRLVSPKFYDVYSLLLKLLLECGLYAIKKQHVYVYALLPVYWHHVGYELLCASCAQGCDNLKYFHFWIFDFNLNRKYEKNASGMLHDCCPQGL